MEDRERRRFKDFVALAIPAIWLSASPFLLIALEADLPIAVGAAVFAATFVHAAYLARPRESGQSLAEGHKTRENWEDPRGSPSCTLSMGLSWRSSDSDFQPACWGFSQQKF